MQNSKMRQRVFGAHKAFDCMFLLFLIATFLFLSPAKLSAQAHNNFPGNGAQADPSITIFMENDSLAMRDIHCEEVMYGINKAILRLENADRGTVDGCFWQHGGGIGTMVVIDPTGWNDPNDSIAMRVPGLCYIDECGSVEPGFDTGPTGEWTFICNVPSYAMNFGVDRNGHFLVKQGNKPIIAIDHSRATIGMKVGLYTGGGLNTPTVTFYHTAPTSDPEEPVYHFQNFVCPLQDIKN